MAGAFLAGYTFCSAGFLAQQREIQKEEKILLVEQVEKAHVVFKKQQVTSSKFDEKFKENLARIDRFYANSRVPNDAVPEAGRDDMPGIPGAPSIADGPPADTQLVRNCTVTTLQLEKLQDWVVEQKDIYEKRNE